MEYTDYSQLLPTQPPEGSIEFCQKRGKLVRDLMIYESAYVKNPLTEKNEKKVLVKCTACGEKYYLDYVPAGSCTHSHYAAAPFGFYNYDLKAHVISGDLTMCPECGAEATAKHIGDFYQGTYRMPSCHLMTVHKIGNVPALVTWYMEYRIDRYGIKHINAKMYEAYVFEKRRCLKFRGYDRHFWSTHFNNEWKQMSQCLDTYGSADFLLPFDEKLFHGTDFENSKIEIFAKTHAPYLISYLKLYQKHKNVENLIVQGFSGQINKLIEQTGGGANIRKWSSNIDGIDWKKVRPHEMLGLDIETYRYAKEQQWTMDEIEFYRTHCDTVEWDFLKPENLRKVLNYGSYQVERLIKYKLPVMKILKYLDKQKQRVTSNKSLICVGFYIDYIDACKKLDVDIGNEKVLFPKSLVQSHDKVTKQVEFKMSAELNRKFEERIGYLQNFVFTADGLMIRPAMSHQELIDEGQKLSHCVANYAKRHAEGKTTIFFIRKEAEPDKPFYTLEFNFERCEVMQNRGSHNCARTDEVRAFEDKWLKFAKKKIKELAKNGKSVNAA